ncbi:MAG: ATP12 family protein [Hyphomicrobiaceae bacterium]|nr:ATP12 family protein [Hyphomicrobiaceae bacterium]
MSDPIRAAAQRQLPKRFYTAVQVEPKAGGFHVLLDGRPVRTPAKAELGLPSAELAAAVAAEWEAQGAHIDPSAMPLTRIANSSIDGVSRRRAEVEDEIARYAANDLVAYRAEAPEALARRQAEAWDPIVAWAAGQLGVAPVVGTGIVHIAQSPGLAGAVKARLAATDPFALAALHVITTLTGSALLALAHAHGAIGAEAMWTAAHIDEDFQIEQWGWDAEASQRRAAREREMLAAVRVLAACAPAAP